ncbi:hypothetical protein D3C80_2123720 [compost metagenome]
MSESAEATMVLMGPCLARSANEATMGAWGISRPFEPSTAGTFCMASKYARQLSGTEAGFWR